MDEQEKGQNFPPLAQILACAKRTCDDADLFEWYLKQALVIIGFNRWKEEVWLFNPISKASFPDIRGKQQKMFPATTEAFLVLAWENIKTKWPNIWELKATNKDAKIPPKDKRYWGKWTPPSGSK